MALDPLVAIMLMLYLLFIGLVSTIWMILNLYKGNKNSGKTSKPSKEETQRKVSPALPSRAEPPLVWPKGKALEPSDKQERRMPRDAEVIERWQKTRSEPSSNDYPDDYSSPADADSYGEEAYGGASYYAKTSSPDSSADSHTITVEAPAATQGKHAADRRIAQALPTRSDTPNDAQKVLLGRQGRQSSQASPDNTLSNDLSHKSLKGAETKSNKANKKIPRDEDAFERFLKSKNDDLDF